MSEKKREGEGGVGVGRNDRGAPACAEEGSKSMVYGSGALLPTTTTTFFGGGVYLCMYIA